MKKATYLTESKTGNQFYDIKKVAMDHGVDLETLPYTIRVLLENVVRNSHDEDLENNVQDVLNWEKNADKTVDFYPSRIILQDLTGVPAIVDLASLRSASEKMGMSPEKINPEIPVDLVVDHSVQIDKAGNAAAFAYNTKKEFERNHERYEMIKWAQNSFKNFHAVAPDTGIIHQINLEYLSPIVQKKVVDGATLLYPDSVFGTDSHTTMINGIGVLGWGVGGIEAEAAMLGTASSFLIPKVVGVQLTGKLPSGVVATDLALTITNRLRQTNLVGKFVEYFGTGYEQLTVADRATIANMSPEYGSTCGYFPFDQHATDYLELTGRDADQIKLVNEYLHNNDLYYQADEQDKIQYSEVIKIDLSKVTTSVVGPKRPQDLVKLNDVPQAFAESISAPNGNHGFGLEPQALDNHEEVTLSTGETVDVQAGDILLSAITSCTNTSNPTVLIGAALLAKKAVEKGMKIPAKLKHSFAPGSQAVKEYLEAAGLLTYLDQLGFNIVAFGCTTCIGNSGKLDPALEELIARRKDLVTVAVESGNRNFESRVHPNIKSNYLASPILVVAYSLAGNVRVDLQKDPIGKDQNGQDVYLKDIWPSTEEINQYEKKYVSTAIYRKVYNDIFKGTKEWNELKVGHSATFDWDDQSTYIANPPYFDDQIKHINKLPRFKNMRVLAKVADSVTTDHISPAGAILKSTPAGQYLTKKGLSEVDFNTYGSRRGNHHVMVRGTLANYSLHNQLANGKQGGFTNYLPENKLTTIYEASQKYQAAETELLVIAGKDYGMGSSRDWAAKGVKLLGVKAVIAESFERIHRSNLVMMGVVPLQFKAGESAETLGLTGKETYDIAIPDNLKPDQDIQVTAVDDHGNTTTFTTTLRFDSQDDIDDYRFGGILNKVLDRKVNED
ncbi:aconitate hydratase AcnA [Levilactobacillus acidifarinae]|uniref:Aconitate hydratase n=1 Tax=Levilactobacillus acidifarinae DSM 19394 = JCM 15949 TaxID=1423715 RepID=A0A0R1LH66_9LACO|nr:aconitate hydratase AcnA [Levilactobacillus acidifarinae]KRK95196.1 aconitate hydratase [Levilactobacillus acidifarinae DSM 19394]GEO70325.1 aconitate hydratase [Levilactobacillus acidifarinae]